MHIEGNQSEYSRNGRVTTVEKPVAQPQQQEANQPRRMPGNPSISRTILSHSLANVLWEVSDTSDTVEKTPANNNTAIDTSESSLRWVKSAYSEYE